MYGIGAIHEMMLYISTMISWSKNDLLCILVAEVVYSRHRKRREMTRCALASHSAQKKIYCTNCGLDAVDGHQASLTERKFCRSTMSRTLARMPAVVVVSVIDVQ